MTYRDLWHRASILLDKGEITLGEYEKMTKPLDREVEQEPILDKIRVEIIAKDKNVKAVRSDSCYFFTAEEVFEIIDKYKGESEE